MQMADELPPEYTDEELATEIDSLQIIVKLFKLLGEKTRRRVMRYLNDRFS